MRSYIIVRFNIEGFHKFGRAREVYPEVGFLADLHRHQFYFELKKKVFHDNRDVEFILFKREVMKYLNDKYFDKELNALNFQNMSCEMIARNLVDKYELSSCSVFEDNENGALLEDEL